MLRAALALALTLATAANAAQSLGAPAELAPPPVLVHLDADARAQLDALCDELEVAGAKTRVRGSPPQLSTRTGGRAPSSPEHVCEIFVIEGELVVVAGKYAFAAFDPINNWDPSGLTELNYTPGPGGNWTPGPSYVPPPAAPKPIVQIQGYVAPRVEVPGVGAAPAAAAEGSMLRAAAGPASWLLMSSDNRDPNATPAPPLFMFPDETPPAPPAFSGAEGGAGSGGAPVLAGGEKPKTRIPRLDPSGKVHTPRGENLPDHVPDDWTEDDLQEIVEDLEQSIEQRKQEQEDLGEDPGHRDRIRREERLKKQIENRLKLLPQGSKPDPVSLQHPHVPGLPTPPTVPGGSLGSGAGASPGAQQSKCKKPSCLAGR